MERAAARLGREPIHVEPIRGRLLPSNALELVRAHDLVVEGADNFATKFLACDACAIAGVPIVQAGAVRWDGWALASTPGSACMRCVFEDIPRDRVETCAEAGVFGATCGEVAALMARAACALATGADPQAILGRVWLLEDGRRRAVEVHRRPGCCQEIAA